jgi:hypothetical protein
MGVMSVVFALFTVGYILGVWTACLVFKQPQRAYEGGFPATVPSPRVVILGDSSRVPVRRP